MAKEVMLIPKILFRHQGKMSCSQRHALTMCEGCSTSQLQEVHHSNRVSGPFLLIRPATLAVHVHRQYHWEISLGMSLRTEEGRGTCRGVTHLDGVGLVFVILGVGFQVIDVYGGQS